MHTPPRALTSASVLLVGWLAWPAGEARAQKVLVEQIDSFVRSEMARQKVPGVAVAVVKDGEVVEAKGFGFANIEHQVPVTPETVFQSGSVGKQFTSAGVMLLVEDGRLALDDPITRFLPEAPPAWKAITVRHLLTHTSGIPDYTPEVLDYRRDYTEDELAKAAFRLPLEFPAGARWNYSNTGYVLLGIIVHKVSGKFYGDFLTERVFGPAGMKTTRVISEEDIVAHRAAGYQLVKGELKNQEWVAPRLNTTADGSLYLSILDFVAWDRALRAGAVLEASSWKTVFTPVRLNSGRPYPYGLGWQVEEFAGQQVRQHGGSWQGFKSYIARYLDSDLTVLVLANLAQADPMRLAEGIAAIVDPRLARPAPVAIEDRDPDATARLREVLAAAAEGRLSREDFAYVRAGFFPGTAARYTEMLKGLGKPSRIELFERKELGDDRDFRYQVSYERQRFLVFFALAPGRKISRLLIIPL